MLANLGARQSLNGIDVFVKFVVCEIITLSELFVCVCIPLASLLHSVPALACCLH